MPLASALPAVTQALVSPRSNWSGRFVQVLPVLLMTESVRRYCQPTSALVAEWLKAPGVIVIVGSTVASPTFGTGMAAPPSA